MRFVESIENMEEEENKKAERKVEQNNIGRHEGMSDIKSMEDVEKIEKDLENSKKMIETLKMLGEDVTEAKKYQIKN